MASKDYVKLCALVGVQISKADPEADDCENLVCGTVCVPDFVDYLTGNVLKVQLFFGKKDVQHLVFTWPFPVNYKADRHATAAHIEDTTGNITHKSDHLVIDTVSWLLSPVRLYRFLCTVSCIHCIPFVTKFV